MTHAAQAIAPGATASVVVVRHTRWLKVTYRVRALSAMILIFSANTILMVHPWLYGGPTGNDLMTPCRAADQPERPARAAGRRTRPSSPAPAPPQGGANPEDPTQELYMRGELPGSELLQRIVVTARFDDLGEPGPLQNGRAWYVGV